MSSPHSCMTDDRVGVLRKEPDPKFFGKKIAIAGYSVRAINLSAKACGLKTLTIDCFADMDMRRLADEFIFVDLERYRNAEGKFDKPSIDFLFEAIEENQDRILSCDYFIVGSMFENYPEYMKKIQNFPNYIGNSWESIKKIRSSENLYKFLTTNDIKIPKTMSFSIDNDKKLINFRIYNNEQSEKQGNHSYSTEETSIIENYDKFFEDQIKNEFILPCILKSEKSGGGFGIFLINNGVEFAKKVIELSEIKNANFIFQEYIKGKEMSVSFISDGENSQIIGLTKQIIGELRFGCQSEFAYCGNVISKKISNSSNYEGNENNQLIKKLKMIIQKILKFSRLEGSNGLDFILVGNDIIFIEINPRFQGTIDPFEAATGQNIVEMHLNSILDCILPKEIEFPDDNTYLRVIYYSPLDFHIMADLQGLNFRDVPLIGNHIFEGQPLCSIVKVEKNEEEAFKAAIEDRDLITRVLGLRNRISKESYFLK